jgi:hypothetical protein
MTLASQVNSAGLVLDIIGASLLWKFGLPPDVSRTGSILIAAEQIDENEVRKAKFYNRVSFWAFLCLVAGFAFQLVSNFIST